MLTSMSFPGPYKSIKPYFLIRISLPESGGVVPNISASLPTLKRCSALYRLYNFGLLRTISLLFAGTFPFVLSTKTKVVLHGSGEQLLQWTRARLAQEHRWRRRKA